ncbi:MAG TPA: di-heme oxidoredictase family protein [Bryobacteraceae bacterium]
MRHKIVAPICRFIAGLSLTIGVVAQQGATEAPAGFTTPILASNPGTQSVSNGLAEPSGDTFARDQAVFEAIHDPTTGLGRLFNASSCVTCHANPVAGSTSQITEIRAGHLDDNGNFVNPTVTINDGMNTVGGRSLINDRAICAQAQEHVPAAENIRTLRAVLNALGDGFVEAIDDNTLIAIAQGQPARSHGLIQGEVIEVPVLEAPGQTRVARFGWKNQHSSLLSFVADAYLNEMGVTNRLKPVDSTAVCKITQDPEDQPDSLGLADIDHFAQFSRGTQVPPRDAAIAMTADAQAGQKLFESVGCNICHVESITTAPVGMPINGGAYTVQEALANTTIHPFGDYLLHDIGTGDGIVQTGPQDTADKMRTAPLWGLRTRSRYMHDLASLTLQAAIERHRDEAREVTHKFKALTATQQQQVITFLNSL